MKKLHKYILAAAAILPLSASAAQLQSEVQETISENGAVNGVEISNIDIQRNYGSLMINMDMNLKDVRLKGDRVIVFQPVLFNGADTLTLQPVYLYGRTRWIQYERDGFQPILGGETGYTYKYSKRPATLNYSSTVDFKDWMNGAELAVKRYDFGCCKHLLAKDASDPIAQWNEAILNPSFRYVTPVAGGPKHRELEKTAFIDFPVDQTVIYPDYRRNTSELDSIQRTINVVLNDPDATIETVWLKGFASPESPYSHNTDLAKGRTAALKEYIQNLYNFDGVQILTDYEPEDWEGLRKEVVKTDKLENKEAILALIDSDMDPDVKEWKIKSTYPADYKYMLNNFYPGLRHTNYKVSYSVRSYSEPAEILEIMKTRPSNLDLNEFYIAAAALQPGSSQYNEVFETAVAIYPDDAIANLNAANAAMQRQDMVSARKYLAKAGDSAEAWYARSVFNAYSENYAQARQDLDKAISLGLYAHSDDVTALSKYIDYHRNK